MNKDNSKLYDMLNELYEAGATIGENQWSGDLSTLITPEKATEAIKKFMLDIVSSDGKMVRTDYGLEAINYPYQIDGDNNDRYGYDFAINEIRNKIEEL